MPQSPRNHHPTRPNPATTATGAVEELGGFNDDARLAIKRLTPGCGHREPIAQLVIVAVIRDDHRLTIAPSIER